MGSRPLGAHSETRPPWLATRWARLNGRHRLAGVDLARGLAVLGMLAAHLYALPAFDVADAATWSGIAAGRSSILFATLAGVSIGLVTGGRRPFSGERIATARSRIAVRALILWLLGMILLGTGVPVYVILPAYGILFLLALPFVGLSARTLFLVAAGVAVVAPWAEALIEALPFWTTAAGVGVSALLGLHYPFPVWIAFVLAGLGATRSGLLILRTQLVLVLAGAALAAIGYGLHALAAPDPAFESRSLWDAVWTARPHSSGILEVIGSGGFALATIGLCLLLCRTVLVWIVLPLRAVGAMPLTAYVGQLVAWAVVAGSAVGAVSDLAGFRALDPFPAFATTALVFCTAWALLVGRGPLEWVVDRAARLLVPEPRAARARASTPR